MTTRCPLHARPLVVEATSGKLFCIPCRLPVRKARYTDTPSRNKSAATREKEREYAKKYYQEKVKG